MLTYPELVEANKSVSVFPGWSDPEPETGYMWFDAALDILGVTENIVLHGGCLYRAPDMHVTFALVSRRATGLRRTSLMRLDWRSLKGGHSNKRGVGPPPWRGRRVSATHLHAFGLNWVADESRMREGDLPVAMDIPEDLQSFEQLRSYVGKVFGISNIEVVSKPKWEYTLL